MLPLNYLLKTPEERREMVRAAMEENGYPTDWDQYVGQERAVAAVMASIQSGKMIPHMALTTPVPGVGKTALAMLMAHQSGRNPYYMNRSEFSMQQARGLLARLEDGDILIMDEFHRLFGSPKKNAQHEWLLSYMQDGKVPCFEDEDLARVTIIAVTTDPSLVPDAMMSRFQVRPVFSEYTNDEIKVIAQNTALHKGMTEIDEDQLEKIAVASTRNPRKAKAIVSWLDQMGTQPYDVDRALWFMGFTRDGMSDIEVLYLTTMFRDFNGRAGESAMRSRLGVQSVGSTEQTLIQMGYLTRTPSGRTLTPLGEARASQLVSGE